MVPFLALGAPTPVHVDLLVRYLKQHDTDCDENLAAAKIVKCSLLMKHCPDDSSKVQVNMHQIVYKVFRKYFLDKYSDEQIPPFRYTSRHCPPLPKAGDYFHKALTVAMAMTIKTKSILLPLSKTTKV